MRSARSSAKPASLAGTSCVAPATAERLIAVSISDNSDASKDFV